MTTLLHTIPMRNRELADKILRLGESVAGITLYQYQRSFALCVITSVLSRNGLQPTALFSRQSGKSEVVAIISLACCILLPCLAKAFPEDDRVQRYKDGFLVGCYGPKKDKAEIVYSRVRKYASCESAMEIYRDPEVDTQLTTSRGNVCAWSNGSICRAETASDNVDNEGATWHLLIIDEAQRISQRKIDKELEPMLSHTNGPMVLIGTAMSASAYFKSLIKQNIDWEKETGRRLHFEYPFDKVVAERRHLYEKEVRRYEKFQRATPKGQAEMKLADSHASQKPNTGHLDYEKSVERAIRKRHGDLDEVTFKMNYRLLWQEAGSLAFDPKIIYAGAVPNLEINIPGVTGHVVAGLDVAKGKNEGTDQSVLTIYHVNTDNPIIPKGAVHGGETITSYLKVLVGLYAFRGEFEREGQYQGICAALASFPTCRYMKVDSTGMGDPVCERLAVLLPHIEVSGLKFHTASKSNGYKNYLIEWNASHISYGAGPATVESKVFKQFVEEHEGLVRVIRNGITTYEAPLGHHDDFTDSGMLANMACSESMLVSKPMAVVESTHFGGYQNMSAHDGGGHTRSDRYRSGRRSSSPVRRR